MAEPTREDLLGLPPKQSKIIKCCRTCYHRTSLGYCPRVGYYCDTEVEYGGKCVKGDKYKLWEPRPRLGQRIMNWFAEL